MEEWENLMKDFVPDEMLTFEVAPRTEEVFISEKLSAFIHQMICDCCINKKYDSLIFHSLCFILKGFHRRH